MNWGMQCGAGRSTLHSQATDFQLSSHPAKFLAALREPGSRSDQSLVRRHHALRHQEHRARRRRRQRRQNPGSHRGEHQRPNRLAASSALAADQAWLWRTPAVAAIRKDFLLPPDRPMVE